MIICGIIQSPERNNDQLEVHQVAGKHQDADSIINAQIDLISTRGFRNAKGIKGWKRKKTKELYLQAATLSSDSLGRPITLGIYMKKEGEESANISRETIVELLNRFSLKMDDDSISDLVSFIEKKFPGTIAEKLSSCSLVLVVFVLIALFFIFSLT